MVALGLVESGIVIEKCAGVGIRQLSRGALTRSEKPGEAAKFLIERTNLSRVMEMLKNASVQAIEQKTKANRPKSFCMGFRSVAATEVTSPDELMTVLKRYLRESNESEIVVASRIGVNHHTLNRWLTDRQSPTKGRLALTACFLRRVGYL